MSEGLAVEGVQQSVTGSIGGSAASVCLATLAVFLRLTTKGSLVTKSSLVRKSALPSRTFAMGTLHLSILGTGEGATVVL